MLNKLLTIILGVSFVFLLLWNRLRTRLPMDFNDAIPNDINSILITCFIILVFVCVLIITLKSLFFPPKPNSLFSKLLTNTYVLYLLRIKDYIINAPYRLYELFFNTINIRHFVVATATPLVVHYAYPKLTYVIFFALPRIIVSLIFVIDLCYNHQFTYFYYSLILLLIPVITHFYLFIIGHLSTVNIMFIDKHLDVVRGNGEVTLSIKNIQPTFEDAMDITKINLSNLMNHRLIFKEILNYSFNILTIKKSYESTILLYTSLCYIIGWSYYLWFIIDPSLVSNFPLILDTIEPFSGCTLNFDNNSESFTQVKDESLQID